MVKSPLQIKNTINEITQMSSIKAVGAISKLLQRPVGIDLIAPSIINLETESLFTDIDDMTVSLYQPIKGTIPGFSFLHFDEQSAKTMADLLYKRKALTRATFTEEDKSALAEITNIMIGNFLSTFSLSLREEILLHRVSVFDCRPLKQINKEVTLLCAKQTHSLVKMRLQFQLLAIRGELTVAFDQRVLNHSIQKVLINEYDQQLMDCAIGEI